MSIIPDRRASDQGMDPEKRPAEATESGPTEPMKRFRVAEPMKRFRVDKFKQLIFSEHYELLNPKGKGKDDYLQAQVLDSSNEKLEGKDLTPVQKHRHSLLSEKAIPTEPEKRLRVTKFQDPIDWEHFELPDPISGKDDYLKAQVLLEGKTLTFVEQRHSFARPAPLISGVKMIPQETQPEILTVERLPAILISDKDAQVAGDGSTQIIQEKPEAAGDYPTGNYKKPEPESIIKELLPAIPFFDEDSEALGDDPPAKIMQEKTEAARETDKKPLFKCLLCGKITHDHNFWDCPDRERVQKMHPYCKVCNEGGHDHSDCAKATEDVLKKLRFCFICDKNTDHDTDDCKVDNAFVLINGVKIPNFCDLCRVVGHRGKECYLNSYDLQYGLDDPSMDF